MIILRIQAQLKVDSGKKGLKAVGEALEGYSSLLDYSVYIPVISGLLFVFWTV